MALTQAGLARAKADEETLGRPPKRLESKRRWWWWRMVRDNVSGLARRFKVEQQLGHMSVEMVV
jgi:hypothetical protein